MTRSMHSHGRHPTIWCAASSNQALYPTDYTVIPLCVLTQEECRCAEAVAARNTWGGSQGLPCREVSTVFCFRSVDDGLRCFLDDHSCQQERADNRRQGFSVASNCQERYAR